MHYTYQKLKIMEFKEIVKTRRSVRKFSERKVPREVINRLLEATFTAPSSRNTRSTRIFVVENSDIIAQMAQMRDYGSAFMKGATLALVVAGDTSLSDLWLVNCSISATMLQLACVEEGLSSCWVHVDGRPQLKDEPEGKQAIDHLRTLIPIPENYGVLCVIAAGYSDFQPAALPEHDDMGNVVWIE